MRVAPLYCSGQQRAPLEKSEGGLKRTEAVRLKS
jgi:hypothetical protein